MLTVSEQAHLRKLRYHLRRLGYSIRTMPKRYKYLGDYAVVWNRHGGVHMLYGSLDDVQEFLARELA